LQRLAIREAGPAIIPIIPIPKPVVPIIVPLPKPIVPVAPKPIAPKPTTPKPIKPVPPPFKPHEPAQANPGSGLRCERGPGDACSNIAPFGNRELESIRTKGRDTQASLLATQKADPLAQDIGLAAVPTKYDRIVVKKHSPPIESDKIRFLGQDGIQVSFSMEKTWTLSTTRKQAGRNSKIDDNILESFTVLESFISPQDRGIVITDSNNKGNDTAAAQDRLRWSDMAMFDVKDAFQTAKIDPSELKYIILNSIQGDPSAAKTQEFIDAAIKRTAGDRGSVNTFRCDPDAPGITTDEIAAYQLLAGSDHVHRVLLMLENYPTSMKNVRIESLSVTTPATRDATDEYNIVIKLAKVENL
jgi:hypothetical protein